MESNPVQAPKKRGRFHIPLERKRQLVGYWFVLPVILGFFCIFVPGIITTIKYSVSTVWFNTETFEMDTIFVGLDNFKAIFDEVDYISELVNTLKEMLINVPVIVLFSFFLAILLNRKHFPGRTFFRVVFFLPVIMESGAASTANAASISHYASFSAAGAEEGLTNNIATQMADVLDIQGFLEQLTFSSFLMDYVLESVSRLDTTINSCGIQVIIFLSALQGVTPSTFEAAQVEGLNGWEMFWKITLPLISPMILVNMVYTAVDSFGGNKKLLDVIEVTMYTKEMPAIGAAMTVFYFTCTTLIVGLIVLIVSRLVFYED